MNQERFFDALGQIDNKYIAEAMSYQKKQGMTWRNWGMVAACLGVGFLALATVGTLQRSVCIAPPPDGPVAAVTPGATATADPHAPPEAPKFVIHWDKVAVNETEGVSVDATRLNYDPEHYTEELWTQTEIKEYYGWELNVPYVPDGLTSGGQAVTAAVWREKATGELVQDQAGRGFWVDFYEDGSPRSRDDIVIPTGFTITVSKLGILHCGLLPVDKVETTDFDGTPVTLTHASLPYGPFDPTQKDPSGLYNKPAGYYDIYVAAFTLDGVEYEIMAQRLTLEELVKITASVIGGSLEGPAVVGAPS